MIVLSQNNSAFINMDNIDSLQIIKDNYKLESRYAIITGEKTGFIILGRYVTRERAQEVIGEIVNAYEEECIFAQLGITDNPINKSYRLPED